MCAKLLQWYLTLCNPIDCSPPGSSAHGIIPATISEWVAISSSRRNLTLISCISSISRWILYRWTTGEKLLFLLYFNQLLNVHGVHFCGKEECQREMFTLPWLEALFWLVGSSGPNQCLTQTLWQSSQAWWRMTGYQGTPVNEVMALFLQIPHPTGWWPFSSSDAAGVGTFFDFVFTGIGHLWG